MAYFDRARARLGQKSSPRGFTVTASIILVVGLLASIGGSIAWAESRIRSQSAATSSTTTDIAHTLQAELQSSGDLTADLRAELLVHPDMTEAQLNSWFTYMGGLHRYSGSIDAGSLVYVTQAGLPAYEAASASQTGQPLQVEPPGQRSDYCFLKLDAASPDLSAEDRPAVSLSVPNVDVCSLFPLVKRQAFLSSGFYATTLPVQTIANLPGFTVAQREALLGLKSMMLEVAPIYQPGMPLDTDAERAAALRQWAWSTFDPTKIVQSAMGTAKNVSVVLWRVEPDGSEVSIGSYGSSLPGAVHAIEKLSADGTWEVDIGVTQPLSRSTIEGQAWAAGIGGVILALIAFFIFRVVVKTRSRALRLVEEKNDELTHKALYDELTGLPNRALIMDRAEQMIDRAKREGSTCAVMCLDVDKFKDVNDTYGHSVGDQLIRSVGARIEKALRACDTVGRFGGDVFVVLVESGSLEPGPQLVAERLLECLHEPFILDTEEPTLCRLSACIGVAMGPRDSAAEMLRDADVALGEAKSSGGDHIGVFDPVMHESIQSRLKLATELREAIDTEQFFLVYQPTFNLNPLLLKGVEALIRWRHPSGRVVPPDMFIPYLEESGLIVPVGAWVLRKACEQAAMWHREGFKVAMAVNVSAKQLANPSLADDVTEALRLSGLGAQWLVIEVTETTLMSDTQTAVDVLRTLKELGVKVAIDDFGTGYSSLAYLRQFAVDTLKIDRTFVQGSGDSREVDALLHAMIQLGKTLNLETLAEGIEDNEQLSRLQAEGCNSGQGFLLARPLEPENVRMMLREHVHTFDEEEVRGAPLS